MKKCCEFCRTSQAVTLWQCRLAAAAAVMSFLWGGVAVFFGKWGFLLFLCTLILSVIIATQYFPRLVTVTGYSVTGDVLIVKKGIILQRTYCIPYKQILYVAVLSSPTERALGLCSLCVSTRSSHLFIWSVKQTLPCFWREFTNG